MAESRIKLRCGDILVVDTARGAMQLAALRRFLAEGFQAHLQHNTLLHQVLVLLHTLQPSNIVSKCSTCQFREKGFLRTEGR